MTGENGHRHRGRLVSIEGISGVGKDYLLDRARRHLVPDLPLVTVAEFSRRLEPHATPDVGTQLLRALKDEAAGDYFLRAGYPRSETLLLLAIKMHDYEHTRPSLQAGHLVVEGRSLHSVAVYQALILHADDPEAARAEAAAILTLAAAWRPLPDLTIIITDDVDTAITRAEQRDQRRFTPAERHLHHHAAALFEHLAATNPTCRILDRRQSDNDTAARQIAAWLIALRKRTQRPRDPHPPPGRND
jgi:dTMP kinase